MTHLLDTNVCIDVMRRDPNIQRAMVNHHPNDLGVSMITVFELYSGVAICQDPDRERRKVEQFLTPIHVLPFDLTPAICAAEVRANLQRRGEMIGPFDLLIASHALALQVVLVTHNAREFGRVSGLLLEDWQEGG